MVSAKALLISALTATLAIAAPTETADKPEGPEVVALEPTDGPTTAYNLLTACNNVNFSGNCITWTGNLNTCYGVGEYNDAISSCKVDGGIYCRLYRDAGCRGEGPLITGPAYNLNDQGFNDAASSFYCYLD